MKHLQKKYNLPNDIIHLIEQYLVYKHEFNEVIDEIDSGKHIIRYNSIYSFDDRYDVYIPKIDNYIEIKLSSVYNHRPNFILSQSKPLYLCKECKKKHAFYGEEAESDWCNKFQCHLLHLYKNDSSNGLFWIADESEVMLDTFFPA
jgi:hypothetical protein